MRGEDEGKVGAESNGRIMKHVASKNKNFLNGFENLKRLELNGLYPNPHNPTPVGLSMKPIAPTVQVKVWARARMRPRIEGTD